MEKEIAQTIAFVKQELAHAEAGHDWFHIERVWKTASFICQKENADAFIVELAALLHDIADAKFHNGDEEMGPQKAGDFLKSLNVEAGMIAHVQQIIKTMSFKSSFDGMVFTSKEKEIVQDADRLDAMGAIGIARAFHYGGYKNRPLYNPAVKPNLRQNKEEYKNSTAPTINHFYEKLLLLKDRMNTQTGKEMAEDRHQFMLSYLEQFYAEWNAGFKT